MAIEYISFSSWRDWTFCPYKFKITRLDKIRLFEGNQYSSFGKAIHDANEQILIHEKQNKENDGIKDDFGFEPIKFFLKRFKEELESLSEQQRKKIDAETITDMKKQGEEIIPLVLPALKQYFGEYDLFEAEYELRQQIDGHSEFDFYGFVDLTLKTKDGKYHIIDWKTCSWGWDMQKRTSKEYTYQLTYYKHFFCKQMNISPEMVETHFCLLKRTAKKDKVEFFRVTSGPKKISNALKLLDNCVINVEKKNFVKNRLACSKCEYNKTEHCS